MRAARRAGMLDLAIIVLGIISEVVLRGALVVPGNAAAAAANILGAPGLLKLFLPAYALPLLAERALCLWLLIRGLRVPSPDRR